MVDRQDQPTGTGQPPPPQTVPGAPPPGTARSGGPSGPRANFGQRLVALIIDTIVLAIVGGGLIAVTTGGTENAQPAATSISTLLQIAYYTFFEGSASGQTLGKRAMNIRVIDFNTGGPIDYGRALVRNLVRIISGFVCALGYLWMLWDREKQTWHDKAANTVVVPTSAYPVERWPG